MLGTLVGFLAPLSGVSVSGGSRLFPKEVPMEQEKKTVGWLLSELDNLECEEAEVAMLLAHLRSKFERYDATLKALTGASYEEHMSKQMEREGA